MNEKFEHVLVRAEQLIARIESILPQPMAAGSGFCVYIVSNQHQHTSPPDTLVTSI